MRPKKSSRCGFILSEERNYVLTMIRIGGIIFFLLAVAQCQVHYDDSRGPPNYCPEYGLIVYPHETACDQYYKCENGTFTHEKCPNGLVFDDHNPIYEFCNYFWKIDCGEKETEPPIPSHDCPWQWGIFPSDSCTQYLLCAWGEANVTDCEEGLAYQEESHSCVWPDDVPGCDSEAIVGFKCPERLSGLSSKFYPFPRFPHHHDCTKLFVCVNQKPRLLNCGYGSAFNLDSYTCDSLDNVPDCKPNYLK